MKKLLTLIFMLATFSISGMNAQYKITNYTDANQINKLVEEGDYIWVCSSGGAFKRKKSDGSLVSRFNTSNSGIARNVVNTMYIDFYGNYWFGTYRGGISMFDGKNWMNITEIDGTNIYDCKVITEDLNGNMWFGINDGKMVKYDGENWQLIDLQGDWYVGTILSDDDGNIWAGIPGVHGSCYKIDPEGNIELIEGPNGYFTTGHGVYDIAKDTEGNIWFSCYGGVFRYHPLTGQWDDYSAGLGGNNYTISQDNDGKMWVSTAYGVYDFDGSSWSSAYLSGETGDRANMVLDLLCDAQGNVWLGTYNGLARIDKVSHSWNGTIRFNALKSNYVETMSFSSDGKARLFGQFQYQIGFDGKYWSEHYENDGCGISWPKHSCTDANDNVWISFMEYGSKVVKVMKFTPAGDVVCYPISGFIDTDWESNFVTDIGHEPKSNTLWVATQKGLFYFNIKLETYGQWTTATKPGMVADDLTGISIDKGLVWYSTASAGLGYYDIEAGKLSKLDIEDGLPSNFISHISHDQEGNLWILSSINLIKYDGSQFTNHPTPHYYRKLTVDSHNNIWLASNSDGAAKFNGKDFRKFRISDGLIENNVSEVVEAPDKDIWFCSGYFGVSRLSTVYPEPDFEESVTCLPEKTIIKNNSLNTDNLTRFEWDINNDGSVEYTTADFEHQFESPGVYALKLTAYNDDLKAEVVKEIQVLESPDISLEPAGESFICSGDMKMLEVVVNNYNEEFSYRYEWNNGMGGSTMNTDTSGHFFVNVSNGMCEVTSDTASIVAVGPSPENEICMVTVDTDAKKNMVVWKPRYDAGIVSYNIYKLFGTSYVPIGNVAVGDPPYFIDYNSNPEALAARYAISAIDTCGNESVKSHFHQTIHLGASIGAMENTIVLDWTPYIDESSNFEPEYYYIYRGLNEKEMVLHDSVSSSFTEWNDLDPGDNRFYQIGVRMDAPCSLTPSGSKKTGGAPLKNSLSNLEDNKLKSPAGSGDLSGLKAAVYPNPFSDKARIVWPGTEGESYELRLMDLQGSVIKVIPNLKAKQYDLERGDLEPGMYFIRISGDKIFQTKIIVR